MINKLINKKIDLNFNMKKQYIEVYDSKNDQIIIEGLNRLKLELLNNVMKKGKKNIALKNINKSFSIIKKYFYIDPLLLLGLVINKSMSVFSVQKYIRGRREKYIPRFNFTKKSIRYVLRSLVRAAKNDISSYGSIGVSLANIIVGYSIGENKLMKENEEMNELVRMNKYILMYGIKKRRKKVMLFRKVNSSKTK